MASAAKPQPRLRRADTTGPGILRNREGKGFVYVYSEDCGFVVYS